jgi:cold shock CspA family protein
MSESERLEGKIRKFVADKRFGFVKHKAGETFFHVNDVEEAHRPYIKEGVIVSFAIKDGEKGTVATNLQVIGVEIDQLADHNKAYLVVHHQHAMTEEGQHEIREFTTMNGVVIVDTDPSPGTPTSDWNPAVWKKSDSIAQKLTQEFADLHVSSRIELIGHRSDGRKTHPYLHSLCSSTHLIRKNNLRYAPKKGVLIVPEFIQYLYDVQKQRSGSSWVILGDETGDLGEFKGRSPTNHEAAMSWIVVPPNCDLPALNPNFHIADNPEDMLTAMTNIADNPEVKVIQFRYQSGESIDGTPTGEAHLNFWKDTLPLVINHIAEQTEGGRGSIPVRIFIEQVGGLEANTKPLAGSISEWKQSMDNPSRHGWQHLNIAEAKVLAKKPLEHPWLGYPDAIGFMGTPRKWDEDTQASIEAALPQLHQVPYIQNALKTCNDLFLSSDSGVPFLQRLFDLSVRDVETYIRTFYSGQLRSIISSLTAREWKKLLDLMQDRSEYRKEQNAIALMFEHTDVQATLQNITLDAYKFEFNMALLGSSNHTGHTTTAQTCKSRIEALFDGGYMPPLHRRRHYQNLSNGSNDNEFDFSLDEADLQELLESVIEHGVQNEEEGKLAGAYALTLALQGEADSLEMATMIETYLREHSADDPLGGNHARRLNLHAELLLESGDVEKARNLMMTEIPGIVERDFRDLLREDGFFMAAFLKACALSGSDQQLYEVVSTYVPALLNDHHPSQRIAFWTVEWARRIGNSEGETFDRCLEHLRHMQALDIFQKEAPGVILACEVLHLEAQGFGEFEAKAFIKTVIANSSATTKLWVEQHPPNDEDWLAPLNFNYR